MCAQHREVSPVPPACPDDHPAAGVVAQWRRRHGHLVGTDALSAAYRTAAENRYFKGKCSAVLLLCHFFEKENAEKGTGWLVFSY